MSELTQAERKWVQDVQKVLNKCPSERIGFYTIGDCNVSLFDKTKEDQIAARQDRGEDFGPAATAVGAVFDEDLLFPNGVYSTAG
ncbi:hypothetical protein [Paraburkholderia sp. GAS32]|uniref:hypothetical protein n=1 Tax=Paraburkholderia sp. GAS32 TaxID=3035129 RepID=UPI003D1F4B14